MINKYNVGIPERFIEFLGGVIDNGEMLFLNYNQI